MPLPVLIIGSGLSGLLLAQGLLLHRIPFQIYERDPHLSSRPQGYRIRLNLIGLHALRTTLSKEVNDEIWRTAVEFVPGLGRLDARTGKVMGVPVGMPSPKSPGTKTNVNGNGNGTASPTGLPPPPGIDPEDPLTRFAMTSRLPVDRTILRSVLLTGLDDYIDFNKSFTHYSITPSSVTAHFSDGTTAEGSLLVGADGYHSRVTRQLVGDTLEPIDMGPRMIYGKASLKELEGVMNKELMYGVRVAVDTSPRPPPPPTAPQTGQSDNIPSDTEDPSKSTGAITQTATVPDPAKPTSPTIQPDTPPDSSPPARPSPVSLFIETCRFPNLPHTSDYVFYVLTSPTGFSTFVTCDASLLSSSCETAASIAEKAVSHFHPSIRAVVERQDRGSCSVWAMTSAKPGGLGEWGTERRVTILGDAVHPMPPTGGLAGNAALRSAASLVRVLSRRHNGVHSTGAREKNKNGNGTGGEKNKEIQIESGSGEDGWTADEINSYEVRMRSEAGRMVTLAHAAATGKYPLGLWNPLFGDPSECLSEEEARRFDRALNWDE